MGFFKARYVRDYVAAAKLKAAVIWAAEIAAVLILGIVLAVGYGKSPLCRKVLWILR
mgnify:FL=1